MEKKKKKGHRKKMWTGFRKKKIIGEGSKGVTEDHKKNRRDPYILME